MSTNLKEKNLHIAAKTGIQALVGFPVMDTSYFSLLKLAEASHIALDQTDRILISGAISLFLGYVTVTGIGNVYDRCTQRRQR